MSSRFVALCLAVVFCLMTPPLEAARTPSIESVQALQFEGMTFCTAFSINEQAGYWASAGHCAAYAEHLWLSGGEPVTIDHHYAVVAFVSNFWDVAVFQTDAHAPAFALADAPAEVRDFVEIIGYPYGLARMVTQGTVATRNILLEHPTYMRPMMSDILDITIAGGNSGSPVLNKKGAVVGILWGGFTDSPHAISITWDAVKSVLGPYWA